MKITELLSSNGFISVNRKLIKVLGLEEAVLIGELASEYNYWTDNDGLKDDFFYSTVEKITEKTGLSSFQQRNAFKTLEENGIVETRKMGLPARRYIRINEDRLLEVLNDKSFKKCTTSDLESEELEVEKTNDINKTIVNNTIEQDMNNISPDISNDISSPRSDSSEYPSWVKSCIEEEKPTTDKPKKKRKEAVETHYDDIIADMIISEELKATVYGFIEMRNMIGEKATDRALRNVINKAKKITNNNEEAMKELFEESIVHNWIDVYDHKDSKYNKPVNRKPKGEIINGVDTTGLDDFDIELLKEGYTLDMIKGGCSI